MVSRLRFCQRSPLISSRGLQDALISLWLISHEHWSPKIGTSSHKTWPFSDMILGPSSLMASFSGADLQLNNLAKPSGWILYPWTGLFLLCLLEGLELCWPCSPSSRWGISHVGVLLIMSSCKSDRQYEENSVPNWSWAATWRLIAQLTFHRLRELEMWILV